MDKIRVLIAEDETIVRDGLTAIINREVDMEVIACADNGQMAYELVSEWLPRIVLMDIKMPIMDGITSTRQIIQSYPDTIVLILTTFSEDQFIVDGLVCGAKGFLLKDLHAAKLVSLIRDADRGELLLPSTIAAKLAGRLQQLSVDARLNPSLEVGFTPRELEVARLLAARRSNGEIAEALYLTEGTVKNYISIIYEKLGTSDRIKAISLLKDVR